MVVVQYYFPAKTHQVHLVEPFVLLELMYRGLTAKQNTYDEIHKPYSKVYIYFLLG